MTFSLFYRYKPIPPYNRAEDRSLAELECHIAAKKETLKSQFVLAMNKHASHLERNVSRSQLHLALPAIIMLYMIIKSSIEVREELKLYEDLRALLPIIGTRSEQGETLLRNQLNDLFLRINLANNPELLDFWAKTCLLHQESFSSFNIKEVKISHRRRNFLFSLSQSAKDHLKTLELSVCERNLIENRDPFEMVVMDCAERVQEFKM